MGCCETREPLAGVQKPNEHSNVQTEDTAVSSRRSSHLKFNSRVFIRRIEAPIDETYTFIKALGEGTYGSVRAAVHNPTGNRRAVKTISKRGFTSTDESQMMMELEMLRRADHPNVLRAYELYEDASSFHLVTEICTGGELLDRILSWSSPSENMVAKIFHQLMSAVAYCHEMNIVHRDLKPENLLFISIEDDSLLKVIDFGVSCLFNSGEVFTVEYGTVSSI
jgi:calcium-dependent protein kinase